MFAKDREAMRLTPAEVRLILNCVPNLGLLY